MFFDETEVSVWRAAGGYGWFARFEVAYRPEGIAVTVRVNFDEPFLGMEHYEPFIEETWNTKAFAVSGAAPVPIKIDFVTSADTDAHFHVDVVNGGQQYFSTMITWPMPRTTPGVAAHEFGHMIGAFDEYEGGATEVVTKGTLMSDRSIVVPAYYFETIADAVSNLAGEAFDLIAPTHGGDGRDKLKGSMAPDAFYGHAGKDVLRGKGGDDWLSGGVGNDKLKGGKGGDVFHFTVADKGKDRILDFSADDVISIDTGGAAGDVLYKADRGKLLFMGDDKIVLAKMSPDLALLDEQIILA